MSREAAADAADLLNDLVGDFVTATNQLRLAIAQHASGALSLQEIVGIQKMCLSHLILACTKLVEVYERYHRVIPEEPRIQMKQLVSEFNRRGISNFRNKVAGHIWDKERGCPWRLSEIMEALVDMAGGDLGRFLSWANDPRNNAFPNTILSVVERARDDLMAAYGLSPDELINR